MFNQQQLLRFASVLFVGCILLGNVAAENPQITNVYKSDFSKPVDPETWSGTDLIDIPAGGKMLKGWGELKLTLAGLPDHQFLRVRIKLAVTGTHDGNEMGPGPDSWCVLDGGRDDPVSHDFPQRQER